MSAGRAEVSATTGLTTIRRLDRGRRPIRPALHRLVVRSFRVRRRRHRHGHRKCRYSHPFRADPSVRGLERIERRRRASDRRAVDLLGRGPGGGYREHRRVARQLCGRGFRRSSPPRALWALCPHQAARSRDGGSVVRALGRPDGALLADASHRAHVHLDAGGHRGHAALALPSLLDRRRGAVGDAPCLGGHGPRRELAGPETPAPRPRLHHRRAHRPGHRALRLAPSALALNDFLAALGNFDTQLYLAIAAQRNVVTSVIAVALTYLNWDGFFWWVLAFLLLRSRGLNRRGIAATSTVVVAILTSWWFTELLKFIVQRPRPFDALANTPGPLPAPETVIAHPSSYSFPSGDASLALGAAVAFAYVSPKYRVPVLLLGVSAALARVVVGVHYPFDVLGGIIVGIVFGVLATRIVAFVRRRLRWRAFVIPHTHWDREWYERFEGYRARLLPMVSRLLDILERDPDFRSFTFDGQTIAIQDYLEKRPADRARVEALVGADRLLIGPWHVLADLLLVSGESIVRNLQEGLRSASELGRAARVAYVADPFGHPAQLPQLLRAFGYDTYVFARGMGDEGESVGSEFWWESPSGDRVRAAHLVDHYSNGLPLVGPADEAPATLRRRVASKTARILDRLTPYANGDSLLLMVGDDHVDAYARLPEAVRAMREVFPNVDARIASLEEYATAMPPLPHVVSGEIASGRYRPILRGVNSTRVWIKQENVACERLLVERCEPLDALTGGSARDEPRELWRMLLQNRPHDSICGCSIDAVHDIDMAPRFAFVHGRGEALARRLLGELAGPGSVPMVWDPLPWTRDAVVPIDGHPTRVHSAGLGLSPVIPAERVAVAASGEGAIENGVLRVEVEPDGSFVVVDKATGERSGRLNTLISEGDRGDEYTYSYAGPTVGSQGAAARRAASVDGDRATVTVDP